MRFNSEHDEYLYGGAVESGVVTGDGNVEAPTGWFAPINIDPSESPDEAAAFAHYGTAHLILHESNEGFVTVLTFPERADRDQRISELEQAFALWGAGIQSEDHVAAVFGYRLAAEFDANLDGLGHGWQGESQRQTTREVGEFIAANADDVRTYLETVEQEWQHAGRQFYRARNGQTGFGQDAAGAVVNRLNEEAQMCGKQTVHLGASGEIEVLP